MLPSLIVMIGYRGSGKSTLAKKIAQRLGWDYLSSDALIEKEVGQLSKWVPKNGWPAFRDREHQVCQFLADCKHAVIDLGGGAVENPDNLIGFLNKAIIFWIDADLSTLVQRLQRDTDRPLLNPSHPSPDLEVRNQMIADETREKYRERIPFYQKYSHYRIQSDRDIEALVDDIHNILKKHHSVSIQGTHQK